MKTLVKNSLACFLGFSVATTVTVMASTESKMTKPVIVSVIDDRSQGEFTTTVDVLFKNQVGGCKWCEIKNRSPYDKNGQFDRANLAQQIKVSSQDSALIYLSWNERVAADTQEITDAIKEAISKGVMVVGDAGVSRPNEPTHNLARTVLGQIPDVLIVGELVEKERLLTDSYFGPEMLTALRTPKEYWGQNLAGAYFASRLVENINKRSATDWLAHFKSAKAKSRKLWPSVEDLVQ